MYEMNVKFTLTGLRYLNIVCMYTPLLNIKYFIKICSLHIFTLNPAFHTAISMGIFGYGL
jgi:hypothetical protein